MQLAYIAGATIFADTNGNGQWDEGEAKATTDAKGNFVLENGSGPLVGSGGTDISTGKPFEGTLTAPEGSTVVNPLTTLQQAFVEKGLSIEDAEAKVAQAFGFDPDKVDLQHFDPIDNALDPDADAATKLLGAQLTAESAKIANMLVAAANTLTGAAGDSLSMEDAFGAMIDSLVENIESDTDGVIDMADPAFIGTMLEDGATFADNAADIPAGAFDNIDNVADEFGEMLATSAENIDDAFDAGGDITEMMEDFAQTQVVVQGEMSDQMSDAMATGGDLTDMTSDFTGDAFDDAVDNAEIGDILPPDDPTPPPTPEPEPTPEPTPTPEPEPEPVVPDPPPAGTTFTVTEAGAAVTAFGGTATGYRRHNAYLMDWGG